jgi:hypothetical protein
MILPSEGLFLTILSVISSQKVGISTSKLNTELFVTWLRLTKRGQYFMDPLY